MGGLLVFDERKETMNFIEARAGQAFFNVNSDRYKILDYDLDEISDDYFVVYDYDKNDIVIVKVVQLDRPIAFSTEGNISLDEFEYVLDVCLDQLEYVNTFFRFDIVHVYLKSNDQALIRHHVDVLPYKDERSE